MKISFRHLVPLPAFMLLACAPSSTVQTAPPPSAPPAATSALPPVGYRTEFGTMWTFDAPPLEYWRNTYGFTPDKAWLDRVRIASVRLPNCSASFVSSNGLVLTNHHCIRDCAVQTSPPDSDYIAVGFIARRPEEEKKCDGLYVDQLESIEDVTTRIRSAITAGDPAAQAGQRTGEIERIQKECAQRTSLTCQVVSLYHGGIYSLYTYRRYSDLRLVFSPEETVSAFGGDPDNFTYPRYNLDAALLRAYVDGRPHTPQHHLKFSRTDPAEGDLVFMIGNPGSTGRLNTLAQMEFLRDIGYPTTLAGYERTLEVLRELGKRNPEAARRFQNTVFSLENSRKAVTGYRSGLIDAAYMAKKAAFEREFRARLAGNPTLSAEYGSTYDAIASAQKELASFDAARRYHSFGPSVPAGGSRLLVMSGQLVRVSSELALPDSSRLAAYRGNLGNTVRASLLREQPVDTLFERLAIAAQLRAAQSELPPSDPFVQAVLAGRTPDQAASAIVSGTRVGDLAFRRALVEGGVAAVASSTDPLIVLARRIDELNRASQTRTDRLNAVITANTERIGRALFATYGTSLPPDATFTLRISDGVVKGYPMNGTIAPYKTTFMGMYARSADFDAKSPFDLPKRWVDRMSRLNLSAPYNFVSTNDNIGGNSGSPVVNRNAEVVGVAFDGNIENVANRFLFRTDTPRSISTHASAVVEALRKVYDAPRVVEELVGR